MSKVQIRGGMEEGKSCSDVLTDNTVYGYDIWHEDNQVSIVQPFESSE